MLGLLTLLAVPFVGAQDEVTFLSTQFNTVEESETFREIIGDNAEFIGMDAGPLIDLILAEAETGEGTVDVVGALHGTYPTLADADVLTDLTDLLEDLSEDRDIPAAFADLGLLDSDDFQYYIPWMQATYIMAASNEALEFLPEGADLNALTWEEFAAWCQNIVDQTGEQGCGFPVAGLFHRFLEGYLYPSFTGGMVSQFASEDAVAMWEFVRDELWPTVNPQSITYEFMQEPLLAGEVTVAFDHTARLINAFTEEPDNFVGFPTPAGPAGRGFMPVIVGLSIPKTAPNPDRAAEVIDFLTQPETQRTVLEELAFFPVVGGVDTSTLPEGVALEAAAVDALITAEDALPALLPVGLGDRGGEINQIFRNAFQRIVIDGEDIQTVLDEEAANLQTLLDETGAPCWAPDPPSEGVCQVN